MIFGQVKGDIGGNITKLRKSYATNEAEFTTIQKMVQTDITNKTTTKSGSATESCLWLKRAFEFITLLLEKLATSEEELSKCAGAAYEATLQKFHGRIIKKTFGAGLSACGSRKDFLCKLSADEKTAVTEMQAFLDAFKPKFGTIVVRFRPSPSHSLIFLPIWRVCPYPYPSNSPPIDIDHRP